MSERDRHSGRCAICKSKRHNEFDELYLSGVTATQAAEALSFGKHTAFRHVNSTGLRARRFGDTLGCLRNLIEHCENLRDANSLQVTGGTLVRALRLQADMAQQAMKSHPGIALFLQLPKAIQDALSDVMRAALTDDAALAQLADDGQVGAGTVHEAEEPSLVDEDDE